jgi:hypothetical protein
VVPVCASAAPPPQVLEGGKRSLAALLEALKPALTGEALINGLDAGHTGPTSRAPRFQRSTIESLSRSRTSTIRPMCSTSITTSRFRKVRRRFRTEVHGQAAARAVHDGISVSTASGVSGCSTLPGRPSHEADTQGQQRQRGGLRHSGVPAFAEHEIHGIRYSARWV